MGRSRIQSISVVDGAMQDTNRQKRRKATATRNRVAVAMGKLRSGYEWDFLGKLVRSFEKALPKLACGGNA
jgi:hypothetical protein